MRPFLIVWVLIGKNDRELFGQTLWPVDHPGYNGTMVFYEIQFLV